METLEIQDAEEANELLRRATDAKFQAMATSRSLTEQLGVARQRLATAVSEWQRGVQISPEQLQRQHVEEQTQQRRGPNHRATAFVQKNMRGFGPRGSTNAKYSGGLPRHTLMSKQIRETGEALPLSFRATPTATPGDPDDKITR